MNVLNLILYFWYNILHRFVFFLFQYNITFNANNNHPHLPFIGMCINFPIMIYVPVNESQSTKFIHKPHI